MEEVCKGNGARLPLSALRLLVSPIQLVSAAVWQTIQRKAAADYGMLEEFVSMVTDIVPELLTACQRAQLILGLRARFILDLCQIETSADSETVQPHLDRMQTLIEAWVTEAGAADTDAPNPNFVDLVKNMLKNPDQRENFFQKVFPEEFGAPFDEALHTLMWLLLSRLEKFLPLHTFQQVASMFGEVSSVLEDCMESSSQCEELRTLLQCQKDVRQLEHSDGSLGGSCIISALKLPCVKTSKTFKPQAQDNMDCELPCESDLEKEASTPPHTARIKTGTVAKCQTSETDADKTNRTAGESGAAVVFGDTARHEENAGVLRSQTGDASRCVKQCSVRLWRLALPLPPRSRPVRQNRGLRMKKLLLKEKSGLCEEAVSARRPASGKAKPPSRAPLDVSDAEDSSSFSRDSSYMAPISYCSEEDSWSYYSEEDSCHKTTSSSPSMTDSWSNYSGDASTDYDSLSSCSNEDPPATGPGRKPGIPDVRAGSPKKPQKVHCFICREHVSASLRAHMRAHFPTGDYACPRCDSRFKLFTSFKMHLRRTCYDYGKQRVDPERPDEGENLHKCDRCHEAFRYKVSLDRHKLTHNELYCGVCRKVLRDRATLVRHKASHTPFQCTRCEETFTLFMPLLRHCENVHGIGRPFKCNHCPKTLPKLRLLILHEWTHTGHLPFQCAQCSCRFRSDADLIYHERVHTKEKPYLCAECGKTFSQNSNLLRHLNLVHGEFRNERRHPCSQCEKSFKEKGALKKHQRSKHLNELFRHPCPYCGKMVSATTLARHKLIHTGERPFECTAPGCDKRFRSTSEVKKHVLMQHTTERPYKCDVCGKGFITTCFLKAHAKIHSGEKPFVCNICGKAFPKLYSMQRHKNLVHTFVTH